MTEWTDAQWLKVKTFVGICSGSDTLENVIDYLDKAEQYTSKAKYVALVQSDRSFDTFSKASEAIGKVKEPLEKGKSLCLDAAAIIQIKEALTVLNNPDNIQPGSQVAADAFGKLFVGVGRFASKLPPPANAYAQILESCGTFFLDIQTALDPERRPNGASMRQVLREIDGH
ncbi:MAG TPA: hypothetical protein VF699_03885 [Caulobacteraceae bacterium]|jgi:hypothetical protein